MARSIRNFYSAKVLVISPSLDVFGNSGYCGHLVATRQRASTHPRSTSLYSVVLCRFESQFLFTVTAINVVGCLGFLTAIWFLVEAIGQHGRLARCQPGVGQPKHSSLAKERKKTINFFSIVLTRSCKERQIGRVRTASLEYSMSVEQMMLVSSLPLLLR
jgi:hypothetical protein